MSPSSWKRWLKTTLARADAHPKKTFRLAVLGVGNEFNGDDAAGVLAARWILAGLEQIPDTAKANCLVIDAGLAPENFSGVLRRFVPHMVLVIDAAEMGEPAGVVRRLNWRDAGGFGASTHLQPISTLAKYLESELGCRLELLGIQPGQLIFDHPLSLPVEQVLNELVNIIVSGLARQDQACAP